MVVVIGSALWQAQLPVLLAPGDLQGWARVLGGPLVLLSAVAALAWLAEGSLEHEMAGSEREEEIAQTRLLLAEQERSQAAQQQALEMGVTTLQQVIMQVADGNFKARAPFDEHTLRPLALSLNLWAERLERQASSIRYYRQLETAVVCLTDTLERQAVGLTYRWPAQSRTIGDRLASAIEAFQASQIRQIARELDGMGRTLEHLLRQKTEMATPGGSEVTPMAGELEHLAVQFARLKSQVSEHRAKAASTEPPKARL